MGALALRASTRDPRGCGYASLARQTSRLSPPSLPPSRGAERSRARMHRPRSCCPCPLPGGVRLPSSRRAWRWASAMWCWRRWGRGRWPGWWWACARRRGSTGRSRPLISRYDLADLARRGCSAFIEWAARYAVDSPGLPLHMALRGARAPRARPERRLIATGQVPLKSDARAPARASSTRRGAGRGEHRRGAGAPRRGVGLPGWSRPWPRRACWTWCWRRRTRVFDVPDPERPSTPLNGPEPGRGGGR